MCSDRVVVRRLLMIFMFYDLSTVLPSDSPLTTIVLFKCILYCIRERAK